MLTGAATQQDCTAAALPAPEETPVPPKQDESSHLRLVRPKPKRPEHPILQHRDPETIRNIFPPLAALVKHYYRAEIEGAHHLPTEAALIVSTHNGGPHTADMYTLFVAYWQEHGIHQPGYGLMHKVVFRIPVLSSMLTKVGALHATRENGRIALREGYPLLVCPGGELDALKPFRDRHRVNFGNRKGFVRLAIEEQVPIVPVVSVGAHETMFVINDGKRLAELVRATSIFRLKSVPLALSFPFGLTIAGIPSVPLPSKVRLRALPPIELAEPPWAAKDENRVDRCFQHVQQTMQKALDDLAASRKHVLLG